MRRSRCIVWALGLLWLASACGSGHARTSSAGAAATAAGQVSAPGATGTTATSTTRGAPATPPSSPASDPCAPGTSTICITAAERYRTISVRVGATFTLELRAPRRSFSEPMESGAKVLELIGSSRSGGAAEAYYRALAPGSVELRSVERPVCRPGRACPLFLVLWEVTVLVRSAHPPSRAG